MQVSLFVEQKRTVEQTQLYKELRAKKAQELQEAALDLSRAQRALLRSHQAYLRLAGRRGDLFDLNQVGREDQIFAAMRWAGLELDAVECESQEEEPLIPASMLLDTDATESAPAEASAANPNRAPATT